MWRLNIPSISSGRFGPPSLTAQIRGKSSHRQTKYFWGWEECLWGVAPLGNKRTIWRSAFASERRVWISRTALNGLLVDPTDAFMRWILVLETAFHKTSSCREGSKTAGCKTSRRVNRVLFLAVTKITWVSDT